MQVGNRPLNRYQITGKRHIEPATLLVVKGGGGDIDNHLKILPDSIEKRRLGLCGLDGRQTYLNGIGLWHTLLWGR